MVPLLSAKEWFKKKRGKSHKKTNNTAPNTGTSPYIPGKGYPPLRNSSQSTLIPYVPPSASASLENGVEVEHEGELVRAHTISNTTMAAPRKTHDVRSTASTTCLGISAQSAAFLIKAHVPDDYVDNYKHRTPTRTSISVPENIPHRSFLLNNNDTMTTLVSPPSTIPDRRTSLQRQPLSFAPGVSLLQLSHSKVHNASHTSLPAAHVSRASHRVGVATTLPIDLTSCPQLQLPQGPARQPSLSRNVNYLNTRHHRVQSEQPPPRPSQDSRSRSTPPKETMSVIETKAQEYARTVKTLWQMVEDENLAYRLADASPAEREWLIFNHKNANFPLQPGVIPHHEARSMGAEHARESRQRLHVARPDPKLAPIEEARRTLESTAEEPEDEDETAANSLFPHRQSYQLPKINFHGQIHAAHASVPHALHHHHHRRSPLDSNSDNVMPPQPHMMMSLPNSPTVSAVDSSSSGVSRHSRRSTLLSPMVLQSAKELQKRDHFTIQQRVDMEEDWRMQARLLRGVEECEERARGVAHVQFQLLQRQKQQYLQQQIHEMPREEYQPTHQDFNRWYDLKQEIDDDDDAVLDLLNDDVRGLDLKEEFEDEDEKLQRELLEKEETKRQELDELEHELNILGIDRFDGLCASVAEQQQQRQPEGGQEGALCGSEQIEGYRQKQLVLQQQLQHQYQQLQLQLQLQRHALRSKKILRRKQALLAAAAAVAKNEAFPGPVPMTMAPPSGPCPSAPMTGTGSATTTPLTSPSYGPVKMTVVPAKMILHEPRPLRPRNGRKLFGSEACCDSMIIKDHDISEAMMAAAAAAAPPPLTVPPIPPRMF